MNVPNALSLLRLFITFFFILAINGGRYRLGLSLFLIQVLTDLLDGFLARTMGAKTRLGAFLDPLADKTMLLSSFIVLTFKGLAPVWFLAVILARDFVLVAGFAVAYRMGLQAKPLPSMLGKVNNALQMFTVVCLLWVGSQTPLTLWFFAVTAFFTLLSGLHYVVRACGMLRGRAKA